jgi:serine/threonine protein kinase
MAPQPALVLFHRDVKPENLPLDAHDHLHLTHFGIADPRMRPP